MDNITYLYDGSFEGLLTIVYDALKTKVIPQNIISEKLHKSNLFETCDFVNTDYNKSDKMLSLISKKVSDLILYNSYNAFLSNVKNKEIIILDYILLGFKYGKNAAYMYNKDTVVNINNICKRVRREAHRMKGFVRFKSFNNEILYAEIAPTNDVLEIVSSHFTKRLKNNLWIIKDNDREKIAIYNKKELKIIDNKSIDFSKLKESAEEKKYQELWKSFFESIAIKERKNYRCQRNFMPKKYWKYMSEVKDE